jgi:molybdate transport system permease protein
MTVIAGALSAAAIVFLALPLVGLAVRSPWSRFGEILTSSSAVSALRVSLIASLGSLAASVSLGIPLAWTLARIDVPGKRIVRALVTLPLVLPPVVGGVALLLAFGRRGLLGQPLADATGVTLPFTLGAVVLAATFVSMPLVVIATEAGLRSVDRRLEEAAATLGATPGYVLRRVTLPLVAPSLLAGVGLCWARALGEFGATITFAGNLPGKTQTLPLAVYLALQSDPARAYLLSFILLIVALLVLVAVRGRTAARL